MIAVEHGRLDQGESRTAWACPRCGGSDWWVSDSRFNGVVRRRQRVCKACHSTMSTIELPQKPGYKISYIPDAKE